MRVNDNHVRNVVKKIWVNMSVSHDHMYSLDNIFVVGNNVVYIMRISL